MRADDLKMAFLSTQHSKWFLILWKAVVMVDSYIYTMQKHSRSRPLQKSFPLANIPQLFLFF